jgi:hypothetical protein
MRRVASPLAAFLVVVAVAAAGAAPCQATSVPLVPTKPDGFWAGTRLTLTAVRASQGRLRVHVQGTIAVRSPGRVLVHAVGCTAGLDYISSWGWTPEHHPVGRQAVASWPAGSGSLGLYLQSDLRGKTRVSYSKTISVGYLNETAWTDCVTLELWRVKAGSYGGSYSPAFDPPPPVPTVAVPHPETNIDNTLFVSLTLNAATSPNPSDGRHVECGPMPAFCPLQRPKVFTPPTFPDFPPAPGYPGSPGYPTAPDKYPYQVP